MKGEILYEMEKENKENSTIDRYNKALTFYVAQKVSLVYGLRHVKVYQLTTKGGDRRRF